MNKIQTERLEALSEATRRMNESDYEEMKFADTDRLISYKKSYHDLWKQRKSGRILSLINDDEERKIAKYENEITERENERIEKQMQPLQLKIKILELEYIIFNGMDDTEHMEEINKKVYGE